MFERYSHSQYRQGKGIGTNKSRTMYEIIMGTYSSQALYLLRIAYLYALGFSVRFLNVYITERYV